MAEQTGFFQKVIDERDGGNAFGRMIGIKTVEVREGYCRMEMEIMPELLNPIGSIHGGCLYTIADCAASQGVTMTVRVPYDKGMLVNMLHEGCQIIRESYEGDAILATARIPRRMEKTFLPYAVE